MKLLESPAHGDQLDARQTMYPSLLTVVRGTVRVGHELSTTYGYVAEGSAHIGAEQFGIDLVAGGFFAVPGPFLLSMRVGMAAIIERFGFRGQAVAGRTEARGRLSYIDGCSDSMLVYPPRRGDPVLNSLHFPPGIRQTQHTHPSIRLGIVARGRGVAWREAGPTGEGWEKPLSPGSVFLLEEQELHSFRTEAEAMDIIAFHPDSDWGPTDDVHPMIQRTYIDHGK